MVGAESGTQFLQSAWLLGHHCSEKHLHTLREERVRRSFSNSARAPVRAMRPKGKRSYTVFDVMSLRFLLGMSDGLKNIAEYVVGGALTGPYHCLSVYGVHYTLVAAADCCICEVHSFYVWYVGCLCCHM
jgi:hypothetical protein